MQSTGLGRVHVLNEGKKLAGNGIGAQVKVDGRTVRELRRRQIAKPIRLTGLPNGRIRLSVTARASDRRGVTAKRSWMRKRSS